MTKPATIDPDLAIDEHGRPEHPARIDPFLNINAQALAVLALVTDESWGCPIPKGLAYVQTHGWYNGRERGVSLMVKPFHGSGCLIVTFGECRGGDSIFVDSWTMDLAPFNGPTEPDFPDAAYRARRYAKPYNAGEAADIIREIVAAWVPEALKARAESDAKVAARKAEGKPRKGFSALFTDRKGGRK